MFRGQKSLEKPGCYPAYHPGGYGIHAVQRCVMHRLGIAKAAVTLQFLR